MTPEEYQIALQNGILGTPENYGGILDPNAVNAARNNGIMNFGASLLASGGPSTQRIGFGQALGNAILQGRTAQQQATQNAINAAILKKQLTDKGKKDLVTALDASGKPVYIDANDAVGKTPYNMQDGGKAATDLQYYQQDVKDRLAQGLPARPMIDWAKDYYGGKQSMGYTVQDINGVPTRVLNRAPVGYSQGTDLTPLSTQATHAAGEAATKSTVAGAEATSKTTATEKAQRNSSYIQEGLHAADTLPIINRSLQLLDSVKTGGIDSAKLAATNLLGVTGADEAELSNNLGKAVLSQLRSTFGAQFTEREGERLNALEAGFGKSTEGNKRILGQVKQIIERSARRGLQAAKDSGDNFTVDEITKSMNMDLSPNSTGKAPQAAIDHLKAHPELKDQFKAKYGYLPDG